MWTYQTLNFTASCNFFCHECFVGERWILLEVDFIIISISSSEPGWVFLMISSTLLAKSVSSFVDACAVFVVFLGRQGFWRFLKGVGKSVYLLTFTFYNSHTIILIINYSLYKLLLIHIMNYNYNYYITNFAMYIFSKFHIYILKVTQSFNCKSKGVFSLCCAFSK